MAGRNETWIDSPVREAAVSAVILFGLGVVVDRVSDGQWSLVRPLIFALVIAAGGPIGQLLVSAETRARWAERRATEPVVTRLRRERTVLVVLCALTVVGFAAATVLIHTDLTAGRLVQASAWVALAVLAIAACFLAAGAVRRATSLRLKRTSAI